MNNIESQISIFELLRHRASKDGDGNSKLAFSSLQDGDIDRSLTFFELDHRARSVAAHLQTICNPGDRALIIYPPGLDYIVAFFGCIYAGIIAVPSIPPANARSIPRLRSIIEDAKPRVALTTAEIARQIDGFRKNSDMSLDPLTWLETDSLADASDRWTEPSLASSDIAFLQYTSGSTGTPKGVMVSHGNIISNLDCIHATLGIREGETTVSWLPLYHDMGLIGNVLYPVYTGAHCIYFSAVLFLMRPYRWLKAISDYRARYTCAPNFAYELCTRKISPAQKASLDLSSLEFALNGAESVRAETLRRFAEAFAACGFHTEALMPVYGLAEATLIVSANTRKQSSGLPQSLRISRAALALDRVETTIDDMDAMEVVAVGSQQFTNHQFVIASSSCETLQPDGHVGEIWVRGPSIAQGYWERSNESEPAFSGHIPEQSGNFLRTGDLGFIYDNTLYVVGRIKEMMIFNGSNVYPQDVEMTIERCDPAFRANGCAAFSVEQQGVSSLVVVQEVEHRQQPMFDGLAARVRTDIAEQHGIFDVSAILLVKAGEIPRTSSGKIQRNRCKERFLSNVFPAQWEWRNNVDSNSHQTTVETDTERKLADIWQEVLNISLVSAEDNFFHLGGHSLAAVEMLHQVRKTFAIELTLSRLFENPVLRDLAQCIDKNAREHTQAPAQQHVIKSDVANRYRPFPLNDIQQAYWVGRASPLTLGGNAAHAYQEIRIRDFDISRFNRALRILIERHDMLRAIINPDGTQQILEKVPPYQAALLDYSQQPKAAVDIELNKIRESLSHQVRTANEWPLFEFRATRVDDVHTHLHISVDLMILDAWSGRIIFDELNELYQNEHAPLVPLDISFRDYVLAEQSMKCSPKYECAARYWRERLPNLAPAPELPLAKNPQSLSHPAFVRRSQSLTPTQWKRLKALSADMAVTPSAVLLTAFSEVLAIWSKYPRFTINLTSFNRLPLHQDVNRIVGDFTSLVFLEVDTAVAMPFMQRVRRLQAQLWRDMEHDAFSGMQLLRELHQLHGNLQTGMPVVFTSTLGHGPSADDVDRENMFEQDIVFGITQTPQVWLDHQIFEHQGELLLIWDAVEEIFPAGMLDEMFRIYVDFLDRITTNETLWTQLSSTLIKAVDTAPSRLASDTSTPLSNALLHEPFDERARSNPEHLAVISPARNLSYGELKTRAYHLAHQLQLSGAMPNRLIAVVMEKGWEQVVAVLGVLYSGAAYLPIDPSLPAERIRHIFEQTDATLVLTQPHLDQKINWPCDIRRIIIDDEIPQEETPTLQLTDVSVDDLAYVIYTSGSTGMPKGVMIDHRGAVNTILDINRRFNLSSADRVIALSALNFDLSVFDIFGTLAAGATIVVPSQHGAKDPSHWLESIRQNSVSVWNSVPALAGMLVEHAETHEKELPNTLRLIMLSGDWIPLALASRLKTQLPNAQLISLGGATEASIWSIFYPIEKIMPDWKSIPYGKALSNQQFHVLDSALRPRPVWTPGELYIGGIGLAKGYWRDNDKTTASFIHHPETGERLYKTGDWGRLLPDGNIEFLGREDCQVKIQGHRIELGEIESTLENHPSVRAAVAIVIGKGHEEKKLAAYVMLHQSMEATDDELSDYLHAHLPAYMVPRIFAFLDDLPLSANGKIDRKSLPEINLFISKKADFELSDPIEREIQRIVEATLNIGAISPDMNLLRLGATSIDMVRIGNALSSTLKFNPSIDFFFSNPSIASLATAYRRKLHTDEPIRVESAASINTSDLHLFDEIEV